MKTKIVLASSAKELVESQLPYRESVARPGNELTIVAPEGCPDSTETEEDEVLAGGPVLEEVVKAEDEGFDAVTIDCALDVAVDAAKEVSKLPVVGAGEAALSQAMIRAGRFSVVAPTDASVAPMAANVRRMGITDRLSSIRSLDMHVLNLDDRYEDTLEKLIRRSEQVISEDAAEGIVLGCTVMGPVARELAEAITVPVIEPAAAAIKAVEGLVDIGF